MRLRPAQLPIEHRLWEFDLWVTPSLGEIKETAKYKAEMARVLGALSVVSSGSLPDSSRYSADIVDRICAHLQEIASSAGPSELHAKVREVLESLAALIFLVTGKSDNNHKCQLPIFLRNTLGWETIPGVKGKSPRLTEENIPRVLDSEKYMGRVASLYVAALRHGEPESRSAFETKANLLLLEFVESVLRDSDSKSQLSAFIQAYIDAVGNHVDPSRILSPLITFQVRGSVSASGGHEPEEMLRTKMGDWGMRRDVDFNSTDVVVRSLDRTGLAQVANDSVPKVETKAKTRAFDFVLPFQTPSWNPRIYVQSQFYAGDSGSVSHKNVDQTAASRQSLMRLYEECPHLPAPLFVEYVDGAGYCASLNRDLRSLLAYESTHDFFQIRSAPIRLRRVLQSIGFLTPLDWLHAIMRAAGSVAGARAILLLEGYGEDEMERALNVACELELVAVSGDTAALSPQALPTARQYLLLDAIALAGRAYKSLAECSGCVLLPGYGPYFGVRLDELPTRLGDELNSILGNTLLADLNALVDAGHVKLH